MAKPASVEPGASPELNAAQVSFGGPYAQMAEGAKLQEPKTPQISFHGEAGTLFGIHVVNLLLTIVTLGIYYFWGKVKVRKYLYSQTEAEGDRFAFHGTGKELLLGWLKAALVFGLIGGITILIQRMEPGEGGEVLARLVSSAALLVLFPVAIVGSRRYRLSRTSWRGIRFSFRGHAKKLIGIFLIGSILTGVTLGIYYPFFQNDLREFLISNAYFGNRSFTYEGKGEELWKIYFWGILFSLFTLGVYYPWFAARKQRYYWEHTRFGTLGFRATVTGWGLLRLKVGNLMLILLTLGLAYPWAQVREMRFTFANLFPEGVLDVAAIQQEAQTASATGEGLTALVDTGFLDVDLGF